MAPAEVLEVSGNILSKGLKVAFNGNAFIQTGGAYAGFRAESGDGMSSTRFSFTDRTTRETEPLTWRVGMNGTKSFSIVNLTTNVQRVSLTESGDFTVNSNISATGNIAAKYQDVAEWLGYAMKSQPLDLNGRKIHQPGTVIGKALEPLTGGEGEILVLLSLQ